MDKLVRISDGEIEELAQFLLSEFTSDETMTIDCLDGYLTAIAIGPTTLMPSHWLSGIWGPSAEDEPAFESMKQAQRVFDLVIKLFNHIVSTLEYDAESIAPLFNVNRFDDQHEFLDAESWAQGFMEGISLNRPAWQPLFDDVGGKDWLRPLYLLGADEVSEKDELLVRSPAQREHLSEQIPDRVVSIYHYWLPYRQAVHERHLATAIKRAGPKVGRNDPCPCGSGKKLKKCCGTASILH